MGLSVIAPPEPGDDFGLSVGETLDNAPGMQAMPIDGGWAIEIRRHDKVSDRVCSVAVRVVGKK